jgi:hypothetical protein
MVARATGRVQPAHRVVLTPNTELVRSILVTNRSALLVERLHVDNCHVASAVCLPA